MIPVNEVRHYRKMMFFCFPQKTLETQGDHLAHLILEPAVEKCTHLSCLSSLAAQNRKYSQTEEPTERVNIHSSAFLSLWPQHNTTQQLKLNWKAEAGCTCSACIFSFHAGVHKFRPSAGEQQKNGRIILIHWECEKDRNTTASRTKQKEWWLFSARSAIWWSCCFDRLQYLCACFEFSRKKTVIWKKVPFNLQADLAFVLVPINCRCSPESGWKAEDIHICRAELEHKKSRPQRLQWQQLLESN